MCAFSKLCGASSQLSFRAGEFDTQQGSVSGPRNRPPSSAIYPLAYAAGMGAITGHVAICVLLVILAAVSATAEDSQRGLARPDGASLRYFVECSELANKRPLSFEEAYLCARVYMKIKLSFVPDVELDDYDGLSPEDKNAVNMVGYRRFMEWRSQNASQVDTLKATLPLSSAFADD